MSDNSFYPRASVLLTDKFIQISSYSGHSLMREDPEQTLNFLSPEVNNELIGLAVLDSLSNSRFIEAGELPKFRKLFDEYRITSDAKIAEKYGYRRTSDIYTKAASCDVERKNNVIIIQPLHHKRGDHWEETRRGDVDHVTIPANSSPENIGKAAWLALSRCTGRRPDILDKINLDNP